MPKPTTYLGYVEEAVRSLKEAAGSSRPAIAKYIKVRRRAKAPVPAAHQHAQAVLCTVTRSPPPPFQHSLGARAASQCPPSCPPFCNPDQFRQGRQRCVCGAPSLTGHYLPPPWSLTTTDCVTDGGSGTAASDQEGAREQEVGPERRAIQAARSAAACVATAASWLRVWNWTVLSSQHTLTRRMQGWSSRRPRRRKWRSWRSSRARAMPPPPGTLWS